MLKYKGKEVTIVNVFNDGDSYHINEDGGYYKWNDEMFENTEPETSEPMSIPNKGTIKSTRCQNGFINEVLISWDQRNVKTMREAKNKMP